MSTAFMVIIQKVVGVIHFIKMNMSAIVFVVGKLNTVRIGVQPNKKDLENNKKDSRFLHTGLKVTAA